MESTDVDCLVAFGADLVAYLVSYARYYGGLAAVVVSRDGERTLLVMQDEVPVAMEHGAAERVAGYGPPGFGLLPDPREAVVDAVGVELQRLGVERVGLAGVHGDAWKSMSQAGRSLLDADPAISKLREVKDADEFSRLVRAYELCWVGQSAISERAVRDLGEIALFSEAQRAAQMAAGEPIEFLADLPSGLNTAKVGCPVHVPSTRVVQPGDAVVADICVGVGGYWGDSAETHLASQGGEVADVRAELLAVLKDCARELRPGNTGAQVFEQMSGEIASRFAGGRFPHHGGHGVGLSSFEGPHVIPGDMTPFELGMVLALEPGVYFPNRFGARVENLFLVTVDGGLELREAARAT